MIQVILKCTKHPRYKALGEPGECRMCTHLWLLQTTGGAAKFFLCDGESLILQALNPKPR